jgi:hypothetical protein
MNNNVNFKIAKLLKKKGFNERVIKCYSSYVKTGMLISVYNCELGENMNDERDKLTPDIHPNPPYFSAPTIAEVVMWFYEKHKIWVWVEQDKSSNEFQWLCRYEDNKICSDYDEIYYNSPIKAYEKAIEYILTDLI